VLANALPNGYGFEWTELTFQQNASADTASLVFGLCVLLVFLILAAQYESWSLPLAIILIVPMCLLSSMVGVWLVKSDNNILTQIGFIVLIGLASKNAILIVEFAKQREDAGEDRYNAVTHAAQLRLRPILMTSFAFILGVLPLAYATGAGAGARNSVGTAVAGGMLASTFLSILFIPVLYVIIRSIAPGKIRHAQVTAAGGAHV
jgi:multidrug efflux pump